MLQSPTLIIIMLLGFFSMLLFSLNTCNNDTEAPVIWTGATTATTPDGRIDNTTSTQKTTSAQTSSSTLDPNFNPFIGNWECTADVVFMRLRNKYYFAPDGSYTEDFWFPAIGGDYEPCTPPRALIEGTYGISMTDATTGIWWHDYFQTYKYGTDSCDIDAMQLCDFGVDECLGGAVSLHEEFQAVFNPTYTSFTQPYNWGMQCTKVLSEEN